MRSLLLYICLVVSTTSCVGISTETTDREAPILDLSDPIVAASLGSPEFAGTTWERRAGRWTIVGDGPLPQPSDVEIIQAASADIPAAITVEPRHLIRTATAGTPAGHPASSAIAVAKGPDVYLLDGSFVGARAASRWLVGRVLVHELVHVAQWYELAPEYVAAARRGKIVTLDLNDGSALVTDWAAATGWADTDNSPLTAAWNLTGVPPNGYAATGPAEDMAESVSLAVSGMGDYLDASRAAWVEGWTGTNLESLAAGKPWVPAGAIEVSSATPLYDESAASEAAPPTVTHTEALYFELASTSPTADRVVVELADRLAGRGLVGTLENTGDRYAGAFRHPDGSVFWVELIEGSDRGATGPLLIYLWMW